MRPGTLRDYRERMLRTLIYIQEHLDPDLTLGEVARVAHFSPYHFHRVFRGMVGETLSTYVRRIRLERAAHHLRFTDRPVVELAFEAGYESHEAFTRAFRTMTGLAPSTYRTDRQADATWIAPSGVRWAPDRPLDAFVHVESGGTSMDVTIEQLEPMRVAFMRHVGPYDECGRTWERFMAWMGSQGLLAGDTMILGLCHDDPEVTPNDKVRYDACITVSADFEAEGDVGIQTIGGGDYAVTTHEGPYSALGDTYAKLYGQWIPRCGRQARAAPCFEVYLNDPEGTEPDELLTDIYAPLDPA